MCFYLILRTYRLFRLDARRGTGTRGSPNDPFCLRDRRRRCSRGKFRAKARRVSQDGVQAELAGPIRSDRNAHTTRDGRGSGLLLLICAADSCVARKYGTGEDGGEKSRRAMEPKPKFARMAPAMR